MGKVIDLFKKFDYIKVPDYQRAYSWENTQIEQFLLDIKEYIDKDINYYIGHFLFEKRENEKIGYVIDGQQRLTTIVIFLSSLFEKIEKLNNEKLNTEELNIKKETIKFSTVDYDNKLFKDRVIDRETSKKVCETQSQKRILEAVKYFNKKLEKEKIENLRKMLKIITNASCTLNEVSNQSEAVQMFIYQNDRGKHPTDLEIIKSLFMYNIHSYSKNRNNDLDDIKVKFETIYKNISHIEELLNENDVLKITLKTYYKDLKINDIDNIKEDINNKNPEEKVEFIKNFTKELDNNFEFLKQFKDDEKEELYIHSIVSLGINIDLYPFIVGIYKFNIENEDKQKLIESLENLLIRIKLIGSRANIISRINEKYEKFIEEGDINPIIERINKLKTATDWWEAYWNNDKLKDCIKDAPRKSYAKFILWKYEISLNTDYEIKNLRYDSKKINLEHIAPQTEPEEKPHGYGNYDNEEFQNLIYSLGNYILLNEKQNKSLGNNPFPEKYESYKKGDLRQQREIIDMFHDKKIFWGKEMIEKRNKKIIKFVMDYYK